MEVCNSKILGGTMEWSRGTMGGRVMQEWSATYSPQPHCPLNLLGWSTIKLQ